MSNPPCDENVFKNGSPIFLASTGPTGGALIFEEWVVAAREVCQQPLDWHYSGGIAQVLFLGDRAAVVDALQSRPLPDGMSGQMLEVDHGGRARAGVNWPPFDDE